MGLKMKYFVLKPRSKYRDDPWARASRRALEAFAESIEPTDSDCAAALREWQVTEAVRNHNLPREPL